MTWRPGDAKPSTTVSLLTPEGRVFVVMVGDGEPERVFVILGKAGTEQAASASAIGALVGRAVRAGASVRSVWKDLAGVTHQGSNRLGYDALSIPDAVAKALAETYLDAPTVHEDGGST